MFSRTNVALLVETLFKVWLALLVSLAKEENPANRYVWQNMLWLLQ